LTPIQNKITPAIRQAYALLIVCGIRVFNLVYGKEKDQNQQGEIVEHSHFTNWEQRIKFRHSLTKV
jgi:hypothetical protein